MHVLKIPLRSIEGSKYLYIKFYAVNSHETLTKNHEGCSFSRKDRADILEICREYY